jgi:hypothetical protein
VLSARLGLPVTIMWRSWQMGLLEAPWLLLLHSLPPANAYNLDPNSTGWSLVLFGCLGSITDISHQTPSKASPKIWRPI